jgi:hypothetical protein
VVIRTELRRSAAPWAAVLSVGIAAVLLFAFSGPWWKGGGAWNREWTGLVRWQRYTLTMVWPFAVGVGALQGLRDHRSGMTELLTTMSRPRRHRVAQTAGAMAIALTAGYLVIFAIGAVLVAGNASYFHWGWAPVLLVGVLSLIGAAWLGMGIARLAPLTLTPPLLAVTALAVAVVTQSSPSEGNVLAGTVPDRIAWLAPVQDGPDDAFTSVAGSTNLGQGLWFLGMAVTGFLLPVGTRAVTKLLAVVPLLAGAAVALPLLPATAAQAQVIDQGAVALVCAEGAPRVCVTNVHKELLATLVSPAREALALLAKVPGAPASVEEVATGKPFHGRRPVVPGVLQIDFDDFDLASGERATTDPDRLRRYLVAGAGTPTCYGRVDWDENYDGERAARAVSAAALTGELKPLSGSSSPYFRNEIESPARPVWDSFRVLPEAEQITRLSAMRVAAETCRGGMLEILEDGVVR